MVIAIDFDGTIHDWEHPTPGFKMGPPIPGAIEAVRALKERGHTIIIHSCRSNDGFKADKVMTDWLKFFAVPYDEVWTGYGKPIASKYIDDRAIEFNNNWSEILERL